MRRIFNGTLVLVTALALGIAVPASAEEHGDKTKKYDKTHKTQQEGMQGQRGDVQEHQQQEMGQQGQQQQMGQQEQMGQQQATRQRQQQTRYENFTLLTDSTIRDLQRMLQTEGFYKGRVDGIPGPKTKSALRQFQRTNNIIASGRLDDETVRQLGVQLPGSDARPVRGFEGQQEEQQRRQQQIPEELQVPEAEVEVPEAEVEVPETELDVPETETDWEGQELDEESP